RPARRRVAPARRAAHRRAHALGAGPARLAVDRVAPARAAARRRPHAPSHTGGCRRLAPDRARRGAALGRPAPVRARAAGVARRGADRRVKVVHLLSGDGWAGAEVATWHLLAGLAEQEGIAASAVVLNDGVLAERLAARGWLAGIEAERGRSFAALLAGVRARLAQADLVHAHGYKQDVLAALSGRPWVSTQHGRPEPWHGAARLRMATYGALDRALQRWAARRVIAVSAEVERWLRPRVGQARLVRAWNGLVDPLPDGGIVPWRERPRRVGVLARLHPVKQVERAIVAVARCPDVELEIV